MKNHTNTINSKLNQFLLFLVILVSNTAQAANFCVDTAAELQAALTTAQSNGQSDNIRVEQGTYFTPGSEFTFNSSEEIGSIVLRGGYTDNCASRNINPSNTILDGNNSNRVLHLLKTDGESSFVVDGFTIQNGRITDSLGGAGLNISGIDDFNGGILVSSNIIKLNVNSNGTAGGIKIVSDSVGLLNCNIINNLIHDNTASVDSAGVISCTANKINLFQNTITENTSISNSGGLRTTGIAQLAAINNIIWGNSTADLRIFSLSNELSNNNIGVLTGNAVGSGSTNNISIDPKFISFTDFRLQSSSPSVGTGNYAPSYQNSVTNFDLDGNPRVSNNKIDMGAYQTDLNDLCVVIPVKPTGAVVVCL